MRSCRVRSPRPRDQDASQHLPANTSPPHEMRNAAPLPHGHRLIRPECPCREIRCIMAGRLQRRGEPSQPSPSYVVGPVARHAATSYFPITRRPWFAVLLAEAKGENAIIPQRAMATGCVRTGNQGGRKVCTANLPRTVHGLPRVMLIGPRGWGDNGWDGRGLVCGGKECDSGRNRRERTIQDAVRSAQRLLLRTYLLCSIIAGRCGRGPGEARMGIIMCSGQRRRP